MSTEPAEHREHPKQPPEPEYSRRVLYSLLIPVRRLAARNGLTLTELMHWVETGYFHELKSRGLKMREMSELLDVSMRKIAMLSKQLKINFLRPEREVALPRRIEFALWAEPLSRARIAQTFPSAEEEDVDAAIDTLLDEERIIVVRGRTDKYDIASPTRRMVGRTWMRRIDGLNNLMANVADAVVARFFRGEERAFARTLQLRIRPEDLPELKRMYEEHVWGLLEELDERARGDSHAIPMGVSILWAPQDAANNEENTND